MCSMQCKSLTTVVVINPMSPWLVLTGSCIQQWILFPHTLKYLAAQHSLCPPTTLHIMCISLTQHLLYVRCRRNMGICPFLAASLLGCPETGDLKLLSVIWIRHSFADAEFEKSASQLPSCPLHNTVELVQIHFLYRNTLFLLFYGTRK